MAKYTILGRQRNGTTITGYLLRDEETGSVGFVDKSECYNLAFNKQINDVVIQMYNGRYNMKGTKYQISSLPDYDADGNIIKREDKNPANKRRLLLTGKFINGKSIIGYQVTLIEGGQIKGTTNVTREKVMDMASKSLIENVRYQRSNGEEILRGVNCKLSQLPVLSLK